MVSSQYYNSIQLGDSVPT